MRRKNRWGAAALACALALLVTTQAGAAPAEPALHPPAVAPAALPNALLGALAPPAVLAPRAAFTDDSDELVLRVEGGCGGSVTAAAQYDCSAPDPIEGAGDHVGEASARGRDLVFISDRDEASGEVYVRWGLGDTATPNPYPPATPTPAPEPGPPLRVTCDVATESHPVLSPDGTRVAYASDAGGGWAIWVTWLYQPIEGGEGPGQPLACADMPRGRVADGPGDDLWPTWLGDDIVVFSRVGPAPLDPLGDLYAAPLGARGQEVPASAAVQLTDTPAAETQPRAFRDASSSGDLYSVLLTTTQFRPDGSLASIRGLRAGALGMRAPASVWPGEPIQGSEAAAPFMNWNETWAVGFTTTREDPYGDVALVAMADQELSGLEADPQSIQAVSDEQGRAESHVAFVETGVSGSPAAVHTRRSLSADVSDVIAADGSSRRTVAAGTLDVDGQTRDRDESAPTYSPDGARIAWSRTAGTGREIVTANADGSDVRPLVSDRPTDALDLEPAWSPDGTRIAFSRVVPPEGGSGRSQIYVAVVASGAAVLLSTPSTDSAVWDESPSWSPDGRRLVIGRRSVPYPDLSLAMSAPASVLRGSAFDSTVTVVNAGGGSSRGAWVDISSVFRLATSDSRCYPYTQNAVWCTLEAQPPGATTEILVSATSDNAGPGTISARVESYDDEVTDTNNSQEVTVRVDEPPDVAVSLDLPASVGFGATTDATVTITNAPSTGETRPFTVGLVVGGAVGSPGRLEFAADGLPAGCTRETPTTAHCDVDSLAAGASTSLGVPIVGVATGIVAMTANVPQLPGELATDDNSAVRQLSVGAEPTPDVAITVQIGPTELQQQDSTTATVTATNAGTGRAGPFTVALTQEVPVESGGAVDFVPTAPGCRPEGPTSVRSTTCDVAGLDPGQTVTLAIPVLGSEQGVVSVVATAEVPRDADTSNNRGVDSVFITFRSQGPAVARAPGPPPPAPPPSVPAPGPSGDLPLVPPPSGPSGPVPVPTGPGGASVVRSAAIRAADGVRPPPSTPSLLWIIDAATGEGAPLALPPDPDCPVSEVCSPTPLEGRVPAWSPNGLAVAYEYRGDVRIAALADASADRPETVAGVAALTGFAADGSPSPSRPQLSGATDPAWSPDGSELAITGQPAGRPDQPGIYALRPDGTGLRTVTQGGGPETEPAWQPFADLSVSVTATPDTGPPGLATVLTVTVRSEGPAPVTDITVLVELPPGLVPGAPPAGCTLEGSLFTCLLPGLAPGGELVVAFPATGPATGAYPVTTSVATPIADHVPDDNTATVTVTVDEGVADLVVGLETTTPGYVGGVGSTTVTVRNDGPQPSTGATLTLHHPDGLATVTSPDPCLTGTATCPVGPLAVGETATFTVATSFAAPGTGDVTARVSLVGPDGVPVEEPGVAVPPRDPDDTNNQALVAVTVLQPTLRLSPTVAAPNGVTLASGTDFPPGAQVVLTWDLGVMQRMDAVTVAPDGTIAPVQIVILRRDQLGVRNLIATGTVPAGFAPVRAELLVAPRSLAPPNFVERN